MSQNASAPSPAPTTTPTPTHTPPPQNPWKIGFAAARANLIPGMMLWALAVLILISYFCIGTTRALFDDLAAYKENNGMWVSIASYVFFSAVIPLVFIFSIKSLRPPRPWWRAVVFAFAMWTFMGISVYYLYEVLTYLYGAFDAKTNPDYMIIVYKILTDQFCFSTCYGAPIVAITHYWKDRGYSFGAVRDMMRAKKWFYRLIVPVIIMNWTVWVPALCVMYSLPTTLQIFIGGLVNGFWSLMALQIAKKTK